MRVVLAIVFDLKIARVPWTTHESRLRLDILRRTNGSRARCKTQDHQGTLKVEKPMSNLERLLRDQSPKIARVP